MKVKIKKLHTDAAIPSYASTGDAGLDLVAVSVEKYPKDSFYPTYLEYSTGISVEIPVGFVGLIFPRSSVTKTDFILKNSVGVIDSGYRGEIKFRFYDLEQRWIKEKTCFYKVGDKIGQLIILPYPQIEFEEVQDLSETSRGERGFGSTGL